MLFSVVLETLHGQMYDFNNDYSKRDTLVDLDLVDLEDV
jgi:hypothetical protein